MPTLLTNDQILARLDAAIKSITVSTLGDSVLSEVKFAQFVRAMQQRAVILREARFMQMDAQQVDIDRIGFAGRVLTAGVKADETVVGTETSVAPTTNTNKLIAKELRALTGLSDRALRRNIERGNLENTLIDLFGEAAGRDFEEWALLADTAYSDATDILSLTDGWIKNAANAVYGTGSGADFDETADTFPENLFEAMLLALPKQYLQDRSEWRFWVPWATENAYRDLLKARGTALGDSAQTGNAPLYYKGIPVVDCPMLERSAAAPTGAGDVALLGHPDNMVWGVFQEVTIERDRVAKQRKTDFVLTIECDANYEDENAAVAAFYDLETPAGS
jgi:hypothetical protein